MCVGGVHRISTKQSELSKSRRKDGIVCWVLVLAGLKSVTTPPPRIFRIGRGYEETGYFCGLVKRSFSFPEKVRVSPLL